MAIFFLLVGIEIKREIVDGELSTLQLALLPIIGAIGGMIVPAGIYVLLNVGHESISGWGVPMATDIAFTLGLIALLGKRVPTSLIVFLSALAIADDLGVILVIGAFYGHGFHVTPLVWGLAVLVMMVGLNVFKVYAQMPYLILGAILWVLVHESGLHATLAGVLTAMVIPSRKSGNLRGIAAHAMKVFESEIESSDEDTPTIGSHGLARLQIAVDRLRGPGYHLQHAIESWCNFLILPLFAFFNMGVVVVGVSFALNSPESLGVIAGLVIGKPLGIVLFCWLAMKLGIANLPSGVTWTQMVGAGCLAGVGFTMSIFVATSAFEGGQLQSVKLSILIASTLSACIGMVILYKSTDRS
jgi:NhaA family Na+:H+ antiporter